MRLISIKNVFKSFLLSLSSPEKQPLSETECLIAEIDETKEKMNYAWNRLDNANPEYVEITVLEILVLETQYCLLNRRYRLLHGLREESLPSVLMPSSSEVSRYSLEKQLQNHVFYGAFFSPTAESSASKSLD